MLKVVLGFIAVVAAVAGIIAFAILTESLVIYVAWNFLIIKAFPSWHWLCFYQSVWLGAASIYYQGLHNLHSEWKKDKKKC